MAEDDPAPAHHRRGLFWKIFGMWPDPRLLDRLVDKPEAERLECARTWLSSTSPEERVAGLMVLSANDRGAALDAILDAIDDADKRVRSAAFVQLMWHDAPPDYGERILSHLGGELRAAERWVQEPWAPGAIGTLGLTDRLLSHVERIAQTGTRRRDRRRATAYARLLRNNPPEWPLPGASPPEQPG